MSRRTIAIATVLCVIALVAFAYWPAHRAGFVWDDLPCLRDEAWLREASVWQSLVSRDFCGWRNYFRPVAVALFAVESRAFDVTPGPMHVISVYLHLANTLLVGLLTHALDPGPRRRMASVSAAMLLYGLHPALVEPVAWISAQTELLVVFFMLSGLVLNTCLRQQLPRALAVSACFLLAAGTKESAAAMPLAILVVDWMRPDEPHVTTGVVERVRKLCREQAGTYLGILATGLAYLGLRHAVLGFLLNPIDNRPFEPLVRLQEVCFTYLAYMRLLIWPMAGLGPVHLVDEHRFAMIDTTALLTDIAAIAMLACGVLGFARRKSLGAIIAAVTVLLLPMLHVIPVNFDESLYHDRYLMAPLALAAALAPAALVNTLPVRYRPGLALGLFVWLALALANIRVSLPLWSTNVGLWQWALQSNPTSVTARENLLAAYITANDPRARELSRALITDPVPCFTCLLNIAYFGISEHDAALASAALARLAADGSVTRDASLRQAYDVASGRLLEMTGNIVGAEQAYRDAIDLDSREPVTQMLLAMLLAHAGRVAEAKSVAEHGLALLPPGERDAQRREFERALGVPSHEMPK